MKNLLIIHIKCCPRLTVLACFISLLAACASSPQTAEMEGTYLDRAQTQEKDGIRVTAAVPSAKESQELFGKPLYRRGVQPVWLKIENNLDEFVSFLPVGLDPAYFTPIEAANLDVKDKKAEDGNALINQQFFNSGLGNNVAPGGQSSGFMFSVLDEGTKSFNVDVIGKSSLVTFTFFIPVPGLRIDHVNVDWQNLYPADEFVDLSRDELIERLESSVCCVRDKKNEVLQALGAPGHVGCRPGLLPRRSGNILHEAGNLIRYLLDFIERRTGILGQQCATNHVGCAAFHRHYGFIGIGLNRAHQYFDLFRGIRRALGESLHFVGDHGKPTTRFAGHRGLYRRIEREDVRLFSNVVDQFDDVADLLRAFSETFDALRCFLNGFANRVHSIDRPPDCLATFVRDLN